MRTNDATLERGSALGHLTDFAFSCRLRKACINTNKSSRSLCGAKQRYASKVGVAEGG